MQMEPRMPLRALVPERLTETTDICLTNGPASSPEAAGRVGWIDGEVVDEMIVSYEPRPKPKV